MALIKCPECKKEISDKAKKCPNCGNSLKYCNDKNKSNKKYIIWIIVGLIVVFIVIIFISKVFNINFNAVNFKNNSTEKYAICSNNSNTIDYVQGNEQKTYVKHILHAKSDMFSNTICDDLKTIAYYYDKNAYVKCGKQDFYANYYIQDSFDNTINDITSNQKYNCIIYDNKENVEKDKIVGSWCGYRYDNTNLKYKFNNDGTIEETAGGNNYKGFYSIEKNNISYGTFLTSDDYYIILLDNHFIYDETTDTIILTSKKKNNKHNVFSRCD